MNELDEWKKEIIRESIGALFESLTNPSEKLAQEVESIFKEIDEILECHPELTSLEIYELGFSDWWKMKRLNKRLKKLYKRIDKELEDFENTLSEKLK